MAKKFKKHSKNITSAAPNNTNHYTKFKKVELAAMGSIVLCKATTVDGAAENYDWNRQSHRDLVKNNCIPDVEIIEGPSVPKNKGWNYGK